MMKTHFKVEGKSAQIQNFHPIKDGVSEDSVNMQPYDS